MKKGVYIALLLILPGMISCHKSENGVCMKGIGKWANESRTITNCSYLDITDRLEIILHQDSLFRIDLQGGENLLPGIVTEQHGDSLFIYDGNACSWFRKYDHKIYVHIHLPAIHNIRFSGSGTVTTDHPLTGNYLAVETWNSGGDIILTSYMDTLIMANHAGTADFYVNGIADHVYAYTGGNGFFYASDLYAREAYVNNSGTGIISIRASDYMDIQIFNLGDVVYYGHPAALGTYTRYGSSPPRRLMADTDHFLLNLSTYLFRIMQNVLLLRPKSIVKLIR